METTLQQWAQRTRTIWTGVLLYAIGSIVYAIFSTTSVGVTTISDAVAFANGRMGGGISFVELLKYVFLTCVIVGYAMYIIGLGNFRSILSGADAGSINRVRTGAIIMVAAYLWTLFGWWVWVTYALNIVAFIFALIGFVALKNSPTFPAKARRGASNLFLSMVLGVIASGILLLLGWIPIIEIIVKIIAGLINIVSLVLIFVGWAQIKNADPAVM